MDSVRKTSWTEQDILDLRGAAESARLEFKQSRLLVEPRSKIVEVLSREVSAFANSEGGQIVIGMAERRDGKDRVADDLDEGIDASGFSIESFRQLVEGNVSPYLPGIRFFKVPLGGTRTGRIAIVVEVPPGTTAYQASDKLYYGRAEHAVMPLHDHEIRMRMMRGRVPSASLGLIEVELLSAEEEYGSRVRELSDPGEVFIHPERMRMLEAPKREFDEYSMSFEVVNVGEVTIRDFMLTVAFQTMIPVTIDGHTNTIHRWRFARGSRVTRGGSTEVSAPERVIFPFDRVRFPDSTVSLHVPANRAIGQGEILVQWTIYLDGASPSSGEIDIGLATRSGS